MCLVLSVRKCIFIKEKIVILHFKFTNTLTFMHLTFLSFNYVCCIIIKYFMYFKGHHSHFTMNERSDGKTDITFELRTVENLRRSIKGKMALFTYTVLFTCTVLSMLLFTTLFT